MKSSITYGPGQRLWYECGYVNLNMTLAVGMDVKKQNLRILEKSFYPIELKLAKTLYTLFHSKWPKLYSFGHFECKRVLIEI